MNRMKLDLALRYRQKLNWCIIPCNTRDKNPIIPWTEYQKRLSEEKEIESWWSMYPDANLAVVVGKHSGVIAVDVDDIEYFQSKGFEIPQTPKALSGGGGEHYILKYPDEGDKRIENYKDGINPDGKFEEKFSIRCKNQYLILPPSIHPETGRPYKWVDGQDPFSIPIADPPQWILDLVLIDPKEEIIKKYTYSNQGDSLKEFIRELKSRINLTDLLLEIGYEGKRQGHYSRFTCPFHDDGKNPDFAVWDDIWGAHDYHDDQGYDGISLMMKLKNWDFMKTLKFLADRVGLEIPTVRKQEDLPAKIEKMIEEADRPEDVEPILREISKLPLHTIKEHYTAKLGEKLKVPRKTIRKDLERIPAEIVEKAKDPLGEFTEEEIAKAKALLKDPDLLNLAINHTEKAGHVGERVNKKTLYLAFTSRLLSEAISEVIKGGSAGGKNALVRAVLNLFPESEYMDYTGISAKSLYYKKDKDLSHKILVIYEAHGSEQADYAIRSSLSEGKLKLLVTIKNPVTGAFESQEIEIPAEGMAYVETTTKSSLHPENQTRLFDLFIDESKEQTRNIFRARSKIYDVDTIEKEKRVFQALQNLLKPYRVYLPFAGMLAEKFPASKTRERRDYPRFLALIEASTLLHQYQRQKTSIYGKEYLVATTEDYRITYEIAQIILSQTLKELTPAEERVLSTAERDFTGVEFPLRVLKESKDLKDIPESTSKKAVKDLSEKGYFEWNGEKGKKSKYELVGTSKHTFSIPSPEELDSL